MFAGIQQGNYSPAVAALVAQIRSGRAAAPAPVSGGYAGMPYAGQAGTPTVSNLGSLGLGGPPMQFNRPGAMGVPMTASTGYSGMPMMSGPISRPVGPVQPVQAMQGQLPPSLLSRLAAFGYNR